MFAEPIEVVLQGKFPAPLRRRVENFFDFRCANYVILRSQLLRENDEGRGAGVVPRRSISSKVTSSRNRCGWTVGNQIFTAS